MSLVVTGILSIAAGVFLCVYGQMMFRIVLAVFGFMVGYTVAMQILGPTDPMGWIIAACAGAVCAAILYFLISIALYIAGAMLGLVLALLLMSVLSFQPGSFPSILLGILGLGLGAFFGRMLGDLILAFASAAVGAYFCVYGLAALFPTQLGVTPADLTRCLNTPFAIVIFVVIVLVSGLAQMQIRDLRQRLLR